MNDEILLPHSEHINITLGLKYLNGNRKLYLKILNSFLNRYKDFKIHEIDENEFKNAMHTLKGLASTLGMETLSSLSKTLHDESKKDVIKKELLSEFSKILKFIIDDLTNSLIKNLLIIDNNSDNIDMLVNTFEQNYEIIVATSINDAIESINLEKIDLILFSPLLTTEELENKLQQENISHIKLNIPIEINQLLLAIRNEQK